MSFSHPRILETSIVYLCSKRLNSNRATTCLSHFKKVNKEDAKLMLQTKIRRWKHKQEIKVPIYVLGWAGVPEHMGT